ncbi:MAG: MOSC domain-containing protein [Methyloligellaceae bacterium]
MMNLTEIYRYPVKGLSPEKLTETSLKTGETISCDRIYALENGRGRFDKREPKHLPKVNFLMLMKHEKLAALQTHFDETDHSLTISRDGKQVTKGVLSESIGRKVIEQFFSAYMDGELKGPPKIVSAPGHSFSDVPDKCVHIVNLNTVREIEKKFNCTINPLRFRANFYIDGAEPWSEFQWMDKVLELGGAQLEVYKRTVRCAATNVDPDTAERDLTIPPSLLRSYGHSDLGVYARVIQDGIVKEGDSLKILSSS